MTDLRESEFKNTLEAITEQHQSEAGFKSDTEFDDMSEGISEESQHAENIEPH